MAPRLSAFAGHRRQIHIIGAMIGAELHIDLYRVQPAHCTPDGVALLFLPVLGAAYLAAAGARPGSDVHVAGRRTMPHVAD